MTFQTTSCAVAAVTLAN